VSLLLLKGLIACARYIPLSPILEGFIILKENPEYKEEHWPVGGG